MASASLSSSTTTLIKPSHHLPRSSFLPSHTFFKSNNHIKIPPLLIRLKPPRTAAAEFDTSIFEIEGFGDLETNQEPQCPPGLRQYETMAILRPNISEDERLAFIHKYEQLLSAGGAMHVEVLNKGVRPLAYSIKKRNKAGEKTTYLDSIQILLTFFTKPESVLLVRETLQIDDDVIRSSTVKIRKRKY